MAKQSTIEQFVQKRAEVAELAKRLSEELESMYAVILSAGSYNDIPVGEVVRVVKINIGVSFPVTCEYLDGTDYDEFEFDSLALFSKENARAVLYELADRKYAEIFGEDPTSSES